LFCEGVKIEEGWKTGVWGFVNCIVLTFLFNFKGEAAKNGLVASVKNRLPSASFPLKNRFPNP
jgi:hypothetical protein